MPASKSGTLNTRKPFKLLLHFSDEELRLFRNFLLHAPLEISETYAQKILEVFDRSLAVNIFERQVGKSEFVAGTQLPTSANAFDKLISAFYDQMQDFLAISEVKKSSELREQLALRAYRDRNMEWKEIRRRFNEAQRELNKLPQSSQLANLQWSVDLDLAIQANARSVPPEDRGYTELLASLENNYVTQKLRLLCAIANDGKIFEAQGQELPAPAELQQGLETWPVLARMYYYVYLVLTSQENEASMAALNQLLDDQVVDAPTYPRSDMLDLYGYLLNALVREANLGKSLALHRLSKLHDHLIEKGILLKNGEISAEHFKNVISAKLKTGERVAARQHYEQFADKIFNDPAHNTSRYNHALLLYAEEKLPEAASELEFLCGQTGNLKLDQFYGLDMRGNLLKVYFDQLLLPETNHLLWDETDEKMVRLLEAFKGYIERRKIPEKRRRGYESYRKLMQKAYAYAFGIEKVKVVDLQELKAEVNNSSASTAAWFSERMDKIAAIHHGS